ncbi:patatin-like phospholipase family protein (plasmid) [Asticcacaulis sp. DW145]|uniref:RpoH suppressor n=1 Tax=Asticcacaulis sp. DW145 TaxID=3095608 RepID=UPI00308B130D|nr:patatin-like phospholipase family protein [Asticcacaulis sp. DW145]
MPTKYCDLVMKGGITSGLVYPTAALALSKSYRFKQIGGTSAGAIAAAVVAAAAVGDRVQHANPSLKSEALGFKGLEKVAAELATKGFIYSLFQPVNGAGNAYRCLVVMAAGTKTVWGKLRKAIAPVIAIVTIAPTRTLFVLLGLLAVGYGCAGVPGIAGAFLPSLLCAGAAGVWFSITKTAGLVRKNRMGLCSGRSVKRLFQNPKPGLTDWLHARLQSLSGKLDDAPLTFKDLWDAPRYDQEPVTAKALSLQMITSGLSHNEPRTLPFETGGFWFRREDFDLLFPKAVVDYMVRKAQKAEISGVTYFTLPPDGELPVLVGMRMSLSFPLLISAVPLYEPDQWASGGDMKAAATPNLADAPMEKSVEDSASGLALGGRRGSGDITRFRVCWFSDGGISSNFPVHLFDAPLPSWPTFAIDLVDSANDEGMEKGSDVYLPKGNNEGWQRRYNPIAAKSATTEIGNFLLSIISTMQNWRDLLQSRAPGYRDRIVQVRLNADEGGLNLNMPQPVLTSIAGKGTLAGEAFDGFSFENHYWIRWRSLAAAYQGYAKRVAGSPSPPIPDYASAYALRTNIKTRAPAYPFGSIPKRQEAMDIVSALELKGAEWKDDKKIDVTASAPRPLPQMTIIPTY